MKLYFLRHGIAEDARPGQPDSQRRLTEEGVEEMRGVARGIEDLDLNLDRILASPLVRARETAEIVAQQLDAGDLLREERRLASGCGFRDLQEITAGFGASERALFVGHEPDLSTMVHVLTGGAVRMGRASLACVDTPAVEPGRGELRWLLKAGHLCKIGLER